MNYKLQAGAAIKVNPDDNVNIPNAANQIVSGTATSTVANSLVDSSKDFEALKISVGDIVYNTTDGTAAYVLRVGNATTLTLSANIMANTEAYDLYTQQNAQPNNGCVLYVGTGGDLVVTTVSGHQVMLKAIPTGTFVPVNVKRVEKTDTTAADIVALW